jgi:hypothetical protein
MMPVAIVHRTIKTRATNEVITPSHPGIPEERSRKRPKSAGVSASA